MSSAFAATPYLTSQNYPSTGIMAATFIGDPCPDTTTDTTSMGGSLNDNPWIIDSNAPNAKADLCSYGAAYELVNVDGQNHAILYAAVSRYSEGTGDLVVYQELKGTEPGRCDDKLIAFDYHSGGGGGVTVYVYTWTGSCAVNGTGSWVLSDPGGYQAAFGVNPISTDSNKGTFGETAVDLTAMGVLPENQCKTFTTGAVISQTGNSATATLQDIIIPAAADTITINNCSSLKVTKVANGPVPSGTTFTYQILQNDLHPVGQSVHAPVLAVDSTTAAPVYTLDTVNFGDGAVVQIDAKIAVGETHTWSNVMAEPDYLVKEVLPTTPGVSLKSISCVAFDRFGIQTSPIVIYENGAYTGDTFPIFPSSTGILPPVCTITNQVTALTLNKVLPNDNGGTKTGADFVLSATPAAGGAAVINKADPAVNDPAVGASALVTAGTYTLAETPASTTGYTTSAWTCVDGATGASVSVSATKQVTIAEGQNVVCSITNDDIPAKLTLVKTVTNDNGGTAAASAWTLSATGPVTLSGPTGTSGDVSAGTYTLSESGGPAGYTAGTWSCALTNTPATPVTVTSGAVSLTLGQDVTCTINNNDQPSTLVLDKVLTNDNGGTATSDQFVLTATGTAGTPAAATTASGGDTNPAAGSSLSFTVNAGEYTLSEAQLAGYTAGTWTCTGATLTGTTLVIPNGVTVTCTITNNDIPAKLTLVKTVTNDNGGTAAASAWTLSATGPVTLSGPTGTSGDVSAGTYTLSESGGPAGYTAGTWSCALTNTPATPVTVTSGAVSLTLGQDVTCTINNNDQPSTLVLDKVLTNDNGGTATSDQFVLTATGTAGTPAAATTASGGDTNPAAGSSLSFTVNAGEYTLSEAQLAGYTAGTWTCTGATLTGTTLVIPNGVTVTCTITNDDNVATLTLDKVLVTDNGGTAVVTDWTLSATGTAGTPAADTPLSGTDTTTGAGSTLTGNVNAGTYTLAEASTLTGYTASAWTCTGGTLAEDGVTLTVALGATVTCSITNDDQTSTLVLDKVLTNDNGGTATSDQFVLTATGTAGTPAAATTSSGGDTNPAAGSSLSFTVNAGEYTLSEAQLAGYTAGTWTCTGATLTGTTLVIPNGVTVTCTITNDDQTSTLVLDKVLTNDNGGTATSDQFVLTATGTAGTPAAATTASGGDTNPAAGSSLSFTVNAGEYTLSEAQLAGYTAGTWTCTGATLTGTTLVIPNGVTVTCTITNDDQTSTLVLDKVLTNDNGGTATSDQFVLTATGTAGTPAAATTSSGGDTNPAAGSSLSFTVNAGEYTLSEAQLAGYTAGTWTCTGATLTGTTLVIPNGVTVTCTITNDDMPASLTLTKGVVNDDGGNATAEDFELTATLAETKVSGWGSASGEGLAAGTYTLSESNVSGYAAGDWSCTITDAEGTQTTSSGPSVTVPNGGSGACSIVNDDKAVDLVLTKDDGGITGTVGMTFPYTITVTNAGERPADLNEPVLVADLLPVGLEVVSVPSTCVATGSEIDCVIDPAALPAGGSVTLTLTVKFAANAAAGPYTNLAVVTTDDDPAPENPTCPAPEAVAKVGALLAPLAVTADPSNNVDCEETPLTPIYGLTLVKAGFEVSGTTWTATDGVVNFGDTVGYSIRATAGGNAQQTMVTVTDVVPTGMTFTPGSNVCLDGVVCTTAYDAATRTLSWTVATLQPGGSFVASFQATVDAAPTVAPGETYAWTGTNVAAVVSKENPKVPSNEVTVKSSKSELPKTGADGLGLAYLGLLLAALGGGLVLVARRRRDEEETA